jgi:hypothetical protein
MALPGNYKVSLSKFEDGAFTELVSPQAFKTITLNTSTLPATDKKALDDFCKKVAALSRVAAATDQYLGELVNKLRYLKQAVIETPGQSLDAAKIIAVIEKKLNQVNVQLNGDASLARREFETMPAINSRIGYIIGSLWNTTAAPTQTMMDAYAIADKKFTPVYNDVKMIADEIKNLEDTLDKSGAPGTPGRLPAWKSN